MAKIQHYRAIKYQVHKTEHGLDIYYIVYDETIIIILRREAAICKLHLLCDEAHRYLANNNHFCKSLSLISARLFVYEVFSLKNIFLLLLK